METIKDRHTYKLVASPKWVKNPYTLNVLIHMSISGFNQSHAIHLAYQQLSDKTLIELFSTCDDSFRDDIIDRISDVYDIRVDKPIGIEIARYMYNVAITDVLI